MDKAQSPHARPTGPSWKNMPLMAIMARRPFPNSAGNFLLISAELVGALDVTPGKPKSPSD
eukprot:8256782-Prorocentrum_lima.AAC.1